jgi:hypothetical protein
MGSNVNRWTAAEGEILKQGWSASTRAQLCSALPGRTWDAIKSAAQGMDLTRPMGRFSTRAPDADSRKLETCSIWTPERVDLLTYLYPTAPWRILTLAFPFATPKGIEKRAHKAGLARRPTRARPPGRWTADKVDVLRENYCHASREVLEALLPEFSYRALEHKAAELGLRRRPRQALPYATPDAGEIWRPIPQFEENYWVSTLGRVAGKTGLMRSLMSPRGSLTVWLRAGRGKRTSRSVARLVLAAFASPAGTKDAPAYRDGNLRNVELGNLRWRTRQTSSARRTTPALRPLGERHRYALNQNLAWATASALLKGASLAPQDRDDVAANMLVAFLAGDLLLEDFPARFRDFARAHNRAFGRHGVVSLDQVVAGTDNLRLGDTISEDEYRERWSLLQGEAWR